MTTDQAVIIALAGAGFLAGQPEWLDRFMAVSGLNEEELREGLAEPGVLAGILAFIMTDDALAQPFCEEQKLPPQTLMMAQQRLETP